MNIPQTIKELTSKWDLVTMLIVFIIVFIPLMITYYFFYFSSERSSTFLTMAINILIVLYVSFVFLYFLLRYNKVQEKLNVRSISRYAVNIFSILGITSFVIWFIYFIFTFQAASEGFTFFFHTIILLSIVGGLFYGLLQYMSRPSTKMRFYEPYFHIPFIFACWIRDKTKDMVKEVKNTNPKIYYLLLGQILLVTLYFLVPYLIRKIYTSTGELLLDKPVYLDKSQTIGSFNEVQHRHKKEENTYYAYAISSWVYIDNQPYKKSGYSTLFNYGNKPRIEYSVNEHMLRVVSMEGNKEKIIYKHPVSLQKWNHICLNYDSGTMDVFLNGTLVGSSINIVTKDLPSTIMIGDTDGIHGGICNVVYYPRRLYSYEISLLYWIFNGKKIPTI